MPIAMVTTEGEMSRVEQAMEAGANEYVMKPFDGSILGAKLEGIGLVA